MSEKIRQEIIFKESTATIYEILTNSKKFSDITGGAPTEINAVDGGAFSLFGEMIVGRHIELVQNQRIVQAWRAANWEEGAFSIVRIDLKEKGSETVLTLEHSSFPEGQAEHLATGWKDHYWNLIEKNISK